MLMAWWRVLDVSLESIVSNESLSAGDAVWHGEVVVKGWKVRGNTDRTQRGMLQGTPFIRHYASNVIWSFRVPLSKFWNFL